VGSEMGKVKGVADYLDDFQLSVIDLS
jgi:hypothetical protein